MNQGFLRMLVMKYIAEEPCSGYLLVKRIHEQTGWKPSFGSIYPLLDKLQDDGLVNVQEKGRSKLYQLTEAGLKEYREQASVRERAHRNIVEQLRMLATMGDEDCGVVAGMLERTHEGMIPPAEIPEAIVLRREMFRLMQEGKLRSQTRAIRSVLAHTVKELKRL